MCSKCHTVHEKPTGKHCQWFDIEEPAVAPQTQQPQPPPPFEMAEAFRQLTATIEGMGSRLKDLESASESRAAQGDTPQPSQQPEPDVEPQASGVPTVRELRANAALNREVQRRLADLEMADDFDNAQAGTTTQRTRGKRSGAARTVQDSIVNDIDWPHFHIYSPPGAEPTTYAGLSVPEFAYGYLHMVDQQGAKFDREIMWDLLKMIMEDASEYPWANVKNFFWILGSHIENDRAKWADTELIQKLRAKHAQKYELPTIKQSAQAPEKAKCCGPYQKGVCTEKADHAGLRHICAHCVKVKAGNYPHPERDCRRKLSIEPPKNEKGGE